MNVSVIKIFPGIILLFLISSCYLIRGYKVRHFQLNDHEKLPSVKLVHSNTPYHFSDGRNNRQYDKLRSWLDAELPQTLTAAFLVIKNDSIIYERYFNGFTESSRLPSFSVAKSFVSTLVAMALEEGKIKSLNDPVTNYLPELYKRDPRFAKITLQHLLDMRSGIKFNEGTYNIKDDAVKLAFRSNLLKHALKLDIEKEPGGEFDYKSINTELLALVVERTTGKKVSAYLQEKIWTPLGAEYDATWNVDSKKRKQEIAYAGLNATARDFAKFGQLYARKGTWEGQQLLDSSWVSTLYNGDTLDAYDGYKNQWWSNLDQRRFATPEETGAFMREQKGKNYFQKLNDSTYIVSYRGGSIYALGVLQQYIYVNPSKHLVIVRLGRNWYHPRLYSRQFIFAVGQLL